MTSHPASAKQLLNVPIRLHSGGDCALHRSYAIEYDTVSPYYCRINVVYTHHATVAPYYRRTILLVAINLIS